MITFTKLRSGEWGARVVGSAPRVGDSITITKKDGSTKRAIVSKVVWSGKDRSGKSIALCAIESDRPASRRYGPVEGAYCFHMCPVGGFVCCPENGPCHDCE